MQQYFTHVREARGRLKPLVERLNQMNRSVYIRGTFGEPKAESIATSKNPEMPGSVPYYSGELNSYPNLDTATSLLDASLRKSISYGLDHLFALLNKAGTTEDIDLERYLKAGEGSPDLKTLALVLGVVIRKTRRRNEKGRMLCEYSIVGDEVLPTLPVVVEKTARIRRHLYNGQGHALTSLGADDISAVIQMIKENKELQKELDYLFMTGLHPYYLEGNKLEFGDPYMFGRVDGFKGTTWWYALSDGDKTKLAYLFTIQIEMIMMEQIIGQLERQLR